MLYKNKDFHMTQNQTQDYYLTELIMQNNGPIGSIKLKFDPKKQSFLILIYEII
jgi:replicative DNA helicase